MIEQGFPRPTLMRAGPEKKKTGVLLRAVGKRTQAVSERALRPTLMRAGPVATAWLLLAVGKRTHACPERALRPTLMRAGPEKREMAVEMSTHACRC